MSGNQFDNEQNRLHTLISVINGGYIDIDQTVIEKIFQYVMSQLKGEPYIDLYPDVAVMLDQSVELSEIYAQIYEVEFALKNRTLPALNNIPKPDLTFLSQPISTPRSIHDAFGALITDFGDRIKLTLNELFLERIIFSPAVNTRSSGLSSDSQLIYLYEPDASTDQVLITFKVYSAAKEPLNCSVEITLHHPELDWPQLADFPIEISYASTTISQMTDAWGVVLFEYIPKNQLPNLQILWGNRS